MMMNTVKTDLMTALNATDQGVPVGDFVDGITLGCDELNVEELATLLIRVFAYGKETGVQS